MNIGRILPTEAAAILNVSPQFVRVAMQQGKLPIGTVIESMAEKFMNIDDLEGKSMTIMVMSAYAEGKAAGKAEERRRWEQKEAVAAV